MKLYQKWGMANMKFPEKNKNHQIEKNMKLQKTWNWKKYEIEKKIMKL